MKLIKCPTCKSNTLPDNTAQYKQYLETLDLSHALWWFIENIDEESPERTELFFYLRKRVRTG